MVTVLNFQSIKVTNDWMVHFNVIPGYRGTSSIELSMQQLFSFCFPNGIGSFSLHKLHMQRTYQV